MRLIVLLLVGIALPNVYMKYLLLEIDGDLTPEAEPESDTEVENEAAPHSKSDPIRDYKGNYTIIFKLLGQLYSNHYNSNGNDTNVLIHF